MGNIIDLLQLASVACAIYFEVQLWIVRERLEVEDRSGAAFVNVFQLTDNRVYFVRYPLRQLT